MAEGDEIPKVKQSEEEKEKEYKSEAQKAEEGGDLWDDPAGNPHQGVARTFSAARMSSTNAPRYVKIRASSELASSLTNQFVNISVIDEPWGSAAFDLVIGVSDITGDGISGSWYPQTIGWTGAYQNTLPYLTPTYRTLEVTFTSGYVRTFQVLVPGRNNSFFIPSGGGYSLYPNHTYPCSSYPHHNYQWKSGIGINNNIGSSAQRNYVCYTGITADPAGVFYDHSSGYTHTGGLAFFIHQAAIAAASNASGILNTMPYPSSTETGVQEMRVVVIETEETEEYAAAVQGQSGQYASIEQNLVNGVIAGIFVSEIIYAENLFDCSTGPTYDVCGDSSSSGYYLTSGLDCNNNTIPTTYLNGTSPAIFDTSSNCCPACDLFTSWAATSADYNTNNGTITINMEDWQNPGTTSGTPWTSGSQYTVTITNNFGFSMTQINPPAGGTSYSVNCTTNITSNTEHQVSVAVADTTITTGMQVSGTGIPANTFVEVLDTDTIGAVTDFVLVDASGSNVPATVAGTNSLTFATGLTHTFGGLAPTVSGNTYTITVVDNTAGGGCTEVKGVTIPENPPIEGCTDNTAVNYDSSADVMCTPNCCIVCDAVSGQLTDPNSNYSGDLFDASGSGSQITNTTNSSTSDGEWFVSTSVVQSMVPYIQLDGTHTYTMTLYPLTIAGDFSTAGSVTATASGLTVANNGTSPANTFTSLPYGHYAVKVELVDSDEAHGLEPCYSIIYGTIKARVCDDPAALNYNTTVPAALRVHDGSLCTYPVRCCNLSNISVVPVGCGARIDVSIDCLPGATSVVGNWELNGVNIPGTGFSLGGVSVSQVFSLDPQYVTDPSATYTVNITATYLSGQICNQTLSISTATLVPICGCTDPTALNYDPSATIDDGSCISQTWDCISGNCVGVNTGLGQYSDITTCQANCVSPYGGCTNSCATNYDPNASYDDGSCTYKACLNSGYSNYQYSCDCGTVMPSATIHDQSCCFDPCEASHTIIETTTDASGTCTGPNSDGSIYVGVVLNTSATFCTISYVDTNNNLIYAVPGMFTGGTSTPVYTGLAPGVYYVVLLDNLGCISTRMFSIGVNSPGAGCMDPYASNYDPTASCDDGSCMYCGCTDILATNYNPNASCNDGSCEYTIVDSPCLPAELNKRLETVDYCLAVNGTRYLNKMTIGTIDDCSIMNNWKLIFVRYLLNKKGLGCLYNCSDGSTPTLSDTQAGISCNTEWVTGGPVTGVNDQAYAGSSITSGTGTEVTDPSIFFVAANTLYAGDVIKMPSGYIWRVSISGGSCPFGCYNPETAQGAQSGHWEFCNDLIHTITITDSTNYLDNFINFVNTFCEDCEIEDTTGFTPIGGYSGGVQISTGNFTQGGINFNI